MSVSEKTVTLPVIEDPPEQEELDKVIIRFAGDSGDGMQLAGTRFTDASAAFGNDLATYPSFPAEIRAPAGTLAGVSTFQVQIADFDILTPGDEPDVLVAMNPAGLKSNLKDVRPNGTIVVNSEAFIERNLHRAGYETNPLEDGSLDAYRIISAPMETLTKEAVKDSGVTGREVLRSKNFFALGIMAWLFNRPMDPTTEWLEQKFSKRPDVLRANLAALKAGWNFGLTTNAAPTTYSVKPAKLEPGTYTNVTGNTAMAWGAIAAGHAAKLPIFYGTYPITPASDILHRGGPSTGLPTKPEQADLLFAIYGRHGEAPMPVLAAQSPSDAFDITIEAARIAIKYMTPVIVLSDNSIATGSEPWNLPDVSKLPDISKPYQMRPNSGDEFLPYLRDPQTFARSWAIPGTPGLEHRIGGLEKQEVTGNVSYDPDNHQLMVDTRAWKIANIANDVPPVEVDGDPEAKLLVLGWGSTYGVIKGAVRRLQKRGVPVATAHLRHLNPFPANLGEVVRGFEKVLIPELNAGQLRHLIRAEYLVPAIGYNKVSAEPFKVSEIEKRILELIES
jgi:2-oxoglutarate ferredoxin oxidoreductase subunit alpha